MNKLQQTLLPIKLERSEERLTSLAGLIVVEELARAKGLWRRVDELFPKPGSGRGYRASAYVKPLVWMLQAGGRRLEDVRELRAEHEVLRRLGLEALPSADALGDWLRRMGSRGVEALGQLNRELLAKHSRGRAGRAHAGCGCHDHGSGETGGGVDVRQGERLSTLAGVRGGSLRAPRVSGRE